MIDLFEAEMAPLHLWMDAARVYYNKGLKDQYMHLLKEVTDEEVERHYGEGAKVQRVQAFCALAETQIKEAQEAKSKSERDSALVSAQNFLSEAATVDPGREVTEQWIAIGQLELAKDEVARAKKSFASSLLPEYGGKVNCGGLIGYGYCCFRQGKYSEALEHYRRALESLGSDKCPNYVRLAMAACYLQLKMPEVATLCYNRVLSLDKHCSEAYAGLGALKILSNKKAEVKQGLGFLKKAYELNPHLSFVLISLCEQFFYRNEYTVVAKLAQTVLQSSNTQEASVKAEAFYYLGMVYYLADQLDQAMACFKSARESDSDYLNPSHGIARVHIRKGNVPAAIEVLEKIVEDNPGDLEGLINLSVLCKSQSEMQKAVQYAEKALSIDKQNLVLNEYLANLLASLDAKKALTYYNQVITKQEKVSKSDSKANILMINNTGVMHYQCGDYVKALNSFEEALKVGGKSVYSYPIKYNIARSHEALGSLQKASSLYKELLKEVPGYLECTLRLAAVCFSMGYTEQAIKYCKEGLGKYKNNPECLAMLAWIFLTKKKNKEAHFYIKEMQQHCPDQDFAQTALGSMYLVSAYKESRLGDEGKFEKHVNSAMKSFKRGLELNKRNMFAAHGLGVCFALLDKRLFARKVFDKILEASKQDIKLVDMPDVWQNKASINLQSGNYQDAWRAYMHCQNKFYGGRNVSIAHLMAQAMNASGRKEAATKLLLQAMHLAPTDLTLKYSLAIVLRGHAQELIEDEMKYGDNYEKRVEDLNFASSRLALSSFYIDYLVGLKEKANREKEYLDLDIHKGALKKIQKQNIISASDLKSELKNAEAIDHASKKQQEAYTEEAEIMILEQKAKEAQLLAKEEEKKREEEELARKQAEKLENLQEKWRMQGYKPGRNQGADDLKNEGGEAGQGGDPSPWSTDLLDANLGLDESSDEEEGSDKEKEKEGEDSPPKRAKKPKKKSFKAPSKRKLKRTDGEKGNVTFDDFELDDDLEEQEDKKKPKLTEEDDEDDVPIDKMDVDTKKPARASGILESDSD
jgi:tetratricopeptide (TPR) repeat protein